MKSIKRRRREGKTDYGARLALLKSGKPRLVIRKTNTALIVQFVESNLAQDKVIIGTTSKVLLTKGIKEAGALKSLAAAYLTGYALGKMAKGKVKTAILDIGLHRNIHKSRIYAALKGVIDAGIEVPHSKEAIPTDEQIKSSKSIGKMVDSIKEKL